VWYGRDPRSHGGHGGDSQYGYYLATAAPRATAGGYGRCPGDGQRRLFRHGSLDQLV
jgi:hypothetical protein